MKCFCQGRWLGQVASPDFEGLASPVGRPASRKILEPRTCRRSRRSIARPNLLRPVARSRAVQKRADWSRVPD